MQDLACAGYVCVLTLAMCAVVFNDILYKSRLFLVIEVLYCVGRIEASLMNSIANHFTSVHDTFSPLADDKKLKFKTYSVCSCIPSKASSSIKSSIEYSISLRKDQMRVNDVIFKIEIKFQKQIVAHVQVF
jgi:hypothetical protein